MNKLLTVVKKFNLTLYEFSNTKYCYGEEKNSQAQYHHLWDRTYKCMACTNTHTHTRSFSLLATGGQVGRRKGGRGRWEQLRETNDSPLLPH